MTYCPRFRTVDFVEAFFGSWPQVSNDLKRGVRLLDRVLIHKDCFTLSVPGPTGKVI